MDQFSVATVLSWAWTVICLGLGWWMKTMWDAQKELRKDLSDLAVEIPRDYVSKVDLAPVLLRIERLLEKVETKLDQKADKS